MITKKRFNSNDKPFGLQNYSRSRRLSTTSEIVLGLKLIFFLLCFITAVTLTFLAVSTDEIGTFLVRLASKHGFNKNQFVVIIDASSSSSRLFAYRFEWGFIDNRLLLFEELHYELGLGLSEFVDSPAEGAKTIEFLLKKAKNFVPQEIWPTTPLLLKANAELTQLPEYKVDNLLSAVRDLFAMSGFSIDLNAVEIMEDSDKAIFSWLTINFLFKRFSEDIQIAVLDLSSDSMQVTFTPTLGDEVTIYADFMRNVDTINHKFNVFTSSYFGLGFLEARQAVFTAGYKSNELNVESVCVNAIIKNRTWTYGKMEYKVSGKHNNTSSKWNSTDDFNACYNLVKNKVHPIPKPNIIQQQAVVAFSYYFEAAVESGLIDSLEEGTAVTVASYHKIAKLVCRSPNDEQAFLCFDLIYISVLLSEGFGLSNDKNIWLYQRFNGHQISWALGCAYNLLINDERFNSPLKNS